MNLRGGFINPRITSWEAYRKPPMKLDLPHINRRGRHLTTLFGFPTGRTRIGQFGGYPRANSTIQFPQGLHKIGRYRAFRFAANYSFIGIILDEFVIRQFRERVMVQLG